MDICGMMLIDMHGVRYANNRRKNPATKRLSGKRKKNYIAKKEFAYRMCAMQPTSAMPKPCLCCERAFCRSMVVMCRGGDVTCFDVMRLLAG